MVSKQSEYYLSHHWLILNNFQDWYNPCHMSALIDPSIQWYYPRFDDVLWQGQYHFVLGLFFPIVAIESVFVNQAENHIGQAYILR